MTTKHEAPAKMVKKLVRWTDVNRGNLRAYFGVEKTDGIVLYSIKLLKEEDGDGYYFAFAQREYVKRDKTKGYEALVDFVDEVTQERFYAEVMPLVLARLAEDEESDGVTWEPDVSKPSDGAIEKRPEIDDSSIPF